MRRSVVCLTLLAFASPTAAAEYKVRPGDALDVVVMGVPEAKHRATIQISGEVSLPLAGQVMVAGLTPSQVRERIASALGKKVVVQHGADGRETPRLVSPDAVFVTIDYRPVYVTGDVAKPGEQNFRPGMIVRQSIAVAGGYDVVRSGGRGSQSEAGALRSEHESLWIDFVREQARLWRIRNELGEKVAPVLTDSAGAPVAPELIKQIFDTENEQLRARATEFSKEKAHFRRQLEKSDAQLATLAEKRKRDEEGVQADAADFEKVREAFQRGITLSARLSEVRRALMLSSAQSLQTIVEISNIERQRGEFIRQSEKVDEQRRAELLRDLQEGTVKVQQLRSRIQANAERSSRTPGLRSELLEQSRTRTEIVVYREGANGRERITASEDMELLPGDVVDASIRTEYLSGVN